MTNPYLRTGAPNVAVLQVIPIPIATICGGSLDDVADLLPLLAKISHRLQEQVVLGLRPRPLARVRMTRSPNVMIHGDDRAQLQRRR